MVCYLAYNIFLSRQLCPKLFPPQSISKHMSYVMAAVINTTAAKMINREATSAFLSLYSRGILTKCNCYNRYVRLTDINSVFNAYS